MLRAASTDLGSATEEGSAHSHSGNRRHPARPSLALSPQLCDGTLVAWLATWTGRVEMCLPDASDEPLPTETERLMIMAADVDTTRPPHARQDDKGSDTE